MSCHDKIFQNLYLLHVLSCLSCCQFSEYESNGSITVSATLTNTGRVIELRANRDCVSDGSIITTADIIADEIRLIASDVNIGDDLEAASTLKFIEICQSALSN